MTQSFKSKGMSNTLGLKLTGCSTSVSYNTAGLPIIHKLSFWFRIFQFSGSNGNIPAINVRSSINQNYLIMSSRSSFSVCSKFVAMTIVHIRCAPIVSPTEPVNHVHLPYISILKLLVRKLRKGILTSNFCHNTRSDQILYLEVSLLKHFESWLIDRSGFLSGYKFNIPVYRFLMMRVGLKNTCSSTVWKIYIFFFKKCSSGLRKKYFTLCECFATAYEGIVGTTATATTNNPRNKPVFPLSMAMVTTKIVKQLRQLIQLIFVGAQCQTFVF